MIRGYEPGDLDACRDLWVHLTAWHREIYASPTIGGDDPGAQFDEHLERVGVDNIRVAIIDGAVVGLAGLIDEDETKEIEPVVVHPDHRGAGIGRALAQTIIDLARDRGITTLSVRPVGRNERAIRFFRSLGLDTVGHVELMLDFREDAASRWTAGPTIAGERFRH